MNERIKEIERIASSNEFWGLGSGDHLNMIDFLLEHIETLQQYVNKTNYDSEKTAIENVLLQAERDRCREALKEILETDDRNQVIAVHDIARRGLGI